MRALSFVLLLLAAACGPNETPAAGAQATAAAESEASAIVVDRLGDAEGRTVVFLAGLASSKAVWDEIVATLEADYDVRLVQIAGFADVPAIDHTGLFLDKVTEDLAAYLDAEPGRDTVLVGHSLGGKLSLRLAEGGADVSELVLVDVLPFAMGLRQPGVPREKIAAQIGTMGLQMNAISDDSYRDRQHAGAEILSLKEEGVQLIKDWSDASDRTIVTKAFVEMNSADFRELLPKIQQPVMSFYPWDETMGRPPEDVHNIYAAQYEGLQNLQLRRVEGSYSYIMLDQPELFLEALTAALRD